MIIQIIDNKKNNFEDELLNGQNNEKNKKIGEELKDMNKSGEGLNGITLQENAPERASMQSEDINSNKNDDNENIDDQDD